ncbi:MAG TPA: hypothetical protein VEF89_26245 [Solirubrobacteraceae bacterium]|nr:hypothetical protein [Solirubrobacteraceae bacterium]
MPVILVLVAIVTAAALALFVFPQAKGNKAGTVTREPSVASAPAAQEVPGTAKIRLRAHRALTSASSGAAARHPARTPATGRPASVRLEVLADARVWICLQNQRGQLPIDGQILPAGAVSPQFVSPAFRIFLGNGSVRLRVDGRVQSIPASSNPVAYSVSQHGVAVLQPATVEPC